MSMLPLYQDPAHVDQHVLHERQLRAAKLVKSPLVQSALASAAAKTDGSWIRMELPYFEDQFSTIEPLKVCVTTFNVGCKRPPPNLSPLVSRPQGDSSGFDLIFVGFQEVDMSASAMWKEETEAATPWISGLMSEIGAEPYVAPTVAPASSPAVSSPGPTAGFSTPPAWSSAIPTVPYAMLPPRQLVGLLLCTFVHKKLLPFIDEVQIEKTATGALGSVGNKGGVGLSLKVHMTSLCLLTAHLAAGQNHTNKRNEDIVSILSTMDFNAQRRQAAENAVVADVLDLSLPQKLPKDHDVVVVAGDLNYRIDLPYDQAVRLANSGEIATLLREDQLIKEMKSPHTPWSGFTDLTPNFRPTYRYDVGTNVYDTSEKRRIPSFTDRILYWAKNASLKQRIETVQLQALQQVMSSDHKPVQWIASIPVRVVVPEKMVSVIDSLSKRVASLGFERVASAKTTVSVAALDFGRQSFHHCHARRSFVLTNQGDCTASVRLFRQSSETSHGLWLRVSPSMYDVLPGESAEIVIEAVIDRTSLGWIGGWLPGKGLASVQIKSKLLLHVVNGPVHTVECSIVVQPSVFGNTLENIIRLESAPCVEGYARSAAGNSSSSAAGGSPTIDRPRLPKELWYLCDAIFKRGMKFPNLFTDAGSHEACNDVMAFLDAHNEPLPDTFPVDAIASCVLVFLSSLQEPIVPSAQYQVALSSIRTGGKAPLLFVHQQLPPLHANVFLYVMSLMNFILRPQYTTYNELSPSVIAQMLAQVLMPRPQTGNPAAGTAVTSQQQRLTIQQDHDDAVKFMMYFLTPPPNNMQ